MELLIKQHLLDNKSAVNISQILEFGFAMWEFISSIYKSDWNKLVTNDQDMDFWQCVLL